LQAIQWAQCALAELDLREERPEAALARLEPLLAEPDVDRGLLLPLLGWTRLEMGNVEQAEREVTEAVEAAIQHSRRLRLVEALRAEGMVRTRQEQWEVARGRFEDAVSLAHSMPYPHAEARILYEYGLLHVRKAEPERARERLAEALVIFRRLGARKDVERTEQESAALDRSADLAR
jgi:tetratricopeptide (TPR) repeat protein